MLQFLVDCVNIGGRYITSMNNVLISWQSNSFLCEFLYWEVVHKIAVDVKMSEFSFFGSFRRFLRGSESNQWLIRCRKLTFKTGKLMRISKKMYTIAFSPFNRVS